MVSKIRRYFISGLVVFLPVALTIYLLVWSLSFLDGFFGRFLEPYFMREFGFYFKGVSIVVGFFIIFLIGFMVTNFFGRKVHAFFENLLLKLPFFRQVYPAFKEIALFLFSRDKLAFKQVVIVEYPRKGLYSFGFLTNANNERASKILGKEICNVFIPSAPGPVTGYVLLVPKKELISTDVSVEEAIKFNISGGVVNPYLF